MLFVVLDIGCGLIPEAMFNRWESGVVYKRALSRFRSENGISHKIGLTAPRYVWPFIKIRASTKRSRPPFRQAGLSGFSRSKIRHAADSRNTLRPLLLLIVHFSSHQFSTLPALIFCTYGKWQGEVFPLAVCTAKWPKEAYPLVRIDTQFSLRGSAL